VWFTDALSSAEVTARSVVPQVLRRHPRHLILCGDSMLTLVILLELAPTAWKQTELVKAAAIGGAAGRQAPVPLPLEDVVLLDLRSPDIRREYRTSAPAAFIDSLPDVAAVQAAWREELLCTLESSTCSTRSSPACSSRAKYPRTAGPGSPGTGASATG
jgi:hypothetical protein